jgi:hypothetical protein
MRVLLTAFGSRMHEPMAELAVQLRALGPEAPTGGRR